MSVENNESQVSLQCDHKGCAESTREYHRTEFHEMIHHAKLAGWLIENRRGQYFHTCPDHAAVEEFD